MTTSKDDVPVGFAAEMVCHLERLAACGSREVHPHKVTVVATRVEGDQFTVVYRQRWSPRLLGRRGDIATFSALFHPRLTPEHLAQIVLQALSEPEDRGRPGPPAWAEGLVADPAAVNWLANLE